MINPVPAKDARYGFKCGNNENCYAKKHGVSWEFLHQNVGGPKEMVGDIDGFLEKNGKFLFLEWKSSAENLPLGQKIAYCKLSTLPDCHVMYVIGTMTWDAQVRAQMPVVHGTIDVYKGECRDFKPCTSVDFIKRVQNWYDWAKSSV